MLTPSNSPNLFTLTSPMIKYTTITAVARTIVSMDIPMTASLAIKTLLLPTNVKFDRLIAIPAKRMSFISTYGILLFVATKHLIIAGNKLPVRVNINHNHFDSLGSIQQSYPFDYFLQRSNQHEKAVK